MVTSSGSRNVGMQKDHSGTIQRQARKALLREFAGLLMSFGAVTVALQLHGANLGEFEPMVLGLAISSERFTCRLSIQLACSAGPASAGSY